jgi:uncharacterized protein YecT (DUF1311 family)
MYRHIQISTWYTVTTTMLKPASLSLLCLSLGLAACGDKPSEPAKSADLSSHFPSFTAVSVSGEAPQFYIDLNTVKSLNNDLLQFKIVRLAEQGYVMQDAISNCQDSVQALDGIQYKADGSIDKPFTGDAQPLPYANQASLAALVKQACDKKTVFSVQPTNVANTETQATPAPTPPPNADPVETQDSLLPDPSPEQLQTRQGRLSIGRSSADMPPDTLLLDGKAVHSEEGNYIAMHKLFPIGETDVVLFSSNCGGSGCSENEFGFLVLKPNAAPKVVSQKDFSAGVPQVKTRQQGDTVYLQLGYNAGRKTIATYKDEHVSIDYKTLPPQALEADECKWLYDELVKGVCISVKSDDPTCADPEGTFTGFAMRGLAAVAEYPGFKADGFTQQCKQACRTGKTVDYASFSYVACSTSKPANFQANVDAKQPEVKPTETTDTPPTTPEANKPNDTSLAAKPDTHDLDAEVIAGCDAQMQTAGAAVECMKGNLQTQKDRLNQAYKLRHDAMSPDQQQALEQTQKAWLDKRNATCGKLTDDTSAADAMPMLNCIYKAVKQRADAIEKMPIPKAATGESKLSQAKDSDNTGTWYKVKAKPNLVVRKQADITGDKLGLIPQGAKVKVLETGLKQDSINGWDGAWVKIQYQDQEGYVFDAFIEKMK